MLRNPEQIARFQEETDARQVLAPVQAMLPALHQQHPRHIAIGATNDVPHYRCARKAQVPHLRRPVIMTNGLTQDDAHIVMPISPTRLFFAVAVRRQLNRSAISNPTSWSDQTITHSSFQKGPVPKGAVLAGFEPKKTGRHRLF